MGLDITYAARVDYVGNEEPPVYDLGICRLYPNPDFPQQADGLLRGFYRLSGERGDFRAGAYSGYGRWREQLCMVVGVAPRPDATGIGQAFPRSDAVFHGAQPPAFGELINFSDCEGVIGPTTSAKLARDFSEYAGAAEAFAQGLEDGDWFLSRYAEWRKAFEVAGLGGAVIFH